MKRIAFCAVLVVAGTNCAPRDLSPEESAVYIDSLVTKKGGLDAKTQKILAQFANIVLGFLGIVQDPKNATNVKDRITDMVNNAVNIVNEAVKKGELSLDATNEEIEEFAREVIRSKRLVVE